MKSKKLIALLLTLCLCAGVFPMTAHAANAISEESAEYEALEVFLAMYAWWGADYDSQAENSTSSNGRNILQALFSEGYCYNDPIYPGPAREAIWNFDGKHTDPLGKYESYAKVSVSKIDWVLKNIFNCSDSYIAAMKTTLDCDYYTHDGFYYIYLGGIGGGFDVDILDITLSGQQYYVTYNSKSVYYDEYWTRYYAILELKNIDGENYWSLYYNKKLSNGENPNIPAPTSPAPVSNGTFSDVKQSDYYYNAVRWGVDQGIVSGTGTNTFSPNQTCTKAQILTFLWRANGSPEPTRKNPFNDISEGRYYYKAAVWAYEKRLTAFLPGNKLGPDEPCTRAMTVTYLWKLAGSPVVQGNVFSDVRFDEEYARAVSWAVSEGITGGTGGTTFSPNVTCTRAQIATFLYRNAGYDRVSNPSPSVGNNAAYSSWSSAYKDFVYGEKFLTVDFPYQYIDESSDWGDQSPWGKDYTPCISLRDLDADGVPELMIQNGHEAALDRDTYVYTFVNGKIEYIGNCMLNISYISNSQYSGVVCEFYAGAGMGSTSYYWKEGNKIRHELIYSYTREFEGTTEERGTSDDALYYGARNNTVDVYSATAAVIENMGWDAFVAKALGWIR